MAAPTLLNTPTVLSGCESTSDGGTWSANSLATDNEQYREGSNSLAWTARGATVTATFTPSSSQNLQNTHIRMWFLSTVAGFMDLKANGGLAIWVSDGTNTGYWYLLGSDNYQGGWVPLVVDTRRAVDEGTKPTMTAITSMGIRYVQTGSPRNADNTWMDQLTFGDGYSITGGTSTDPVTWQEIADKDDLTTEAWGIVRKINGVFFVNGELTFDNCYFRDGNELVVFVDEPVDDYLYGLNVLESSSGSVTYFQLGEEVGSGNSSIGSGGGVVKGKQLADAAEIADISQTTGGTGRVVDNDGSQQGIGQSFQLSESGCVNSIELYLTSVTAEGSGSDDVIIRIWEDGIRKGLIGQSDPVNVSDLTASALNVWAFSKPPFLAASTTYYMTVEYVAEDTTTDTFTVDSSGTSQITGTAYTHARASVDTYHPDNWSSVAASDLRMEVNIKQRLRPSFDFSSGDANLLSMFGVTLLDCGEFDLSVTANKWVSCALSGCGMVTHDNGAEFRDGSISDAVGTGIELVDPPTDPEFRNVNLLNSPVGLRISTNGDWDLRNIGFSGNDIDIEVVAPFVSGQSVDINILENGDTPTIVNNGGSTVNLTVSASHTLTGLQQFTEVTYVDTADGTTVLFHVEDVDSTGETTYNYNASVEKTVDILIHHVDYVPILIENVVLGSTGGEIPISQRIDRIYSNPT